MARMARNWNETLNLPLLATPVWLCCAAAMAIRR